MAWAVACHVALEQVDRWSSRSEGLTQGFTQHLDLMSGCWVGQLTFVLTRQFGPGSIQNGPYGSYESPGASNKYVFQVVYNILGIGIAYCRCYSLVEELVCLARAGPE